MIDFVVIEDFARKAHDGQTRWGGEPYVTHPIWVSDYVVCSPFLRTDKQRSVAKALALLHDVSEDCPDVTFVELINVLARAGFTMDEARAMAYVDLDLLTHQDGYTYAQYIKRLVKEGCSVTRSVKIADLTHNLLDLKDGQRRQKYELAKAWLENV